jgi:hypothetical protein
MKGLAVVASVILCRITATTVLLAGAPAYAGDKVEKALERPAKFVEKTARRAGKFTEKTAKRAAKFTEKTANRAAKAVKKAVE